MNNIADDVVDGMVAREVAERLGIDEDDAFAIVRHMPRVGGRRRAEDKMDLVACENKVRRLRKNLDSKGSKMSSSMGTEAEPDAAAEEWAARVAYYNADEELRRMRGARRQP